MRPHGRASVSARRPQAFAICDRCGFLYNHSDLRWQWDWQGASLVNKKLLVCTTCNDDQNEQLRSIRISADPIPITNPRVQDYAQASANNRVTSGQTTVDFWTGIPVPGDDVRVTESGETRVVQQTGNAPGAINEEPGTDPNAPGDNDPGLPYNNDEVPNTGPL